MRNDDAIRRISHVALYRSLASLVLMLAMGQGQALAVSQAQLRTAARSARTAAWSRVGGTPAACRAPDARPGQIRSRGLRHAPRRRPRERIWPGARRNPGDVARARDRSGVFVTNTTGGSEDVK